MDSFVTELDILRNSLLVNEVVSAYLQKGKKPTLRGLNSNHSAELRFAEALY